MITIPKQFLDDEVQCRSATIEDVKPEGVLVIKAVPYDVEIQLATDLFESFAPGAFARAANAPTRLHLWSGHQTLPDGTITRGPLVGRGVSVEDRPDGCWMEAKVSQTPAGVEMLTLIQDGVLTDPSIEFRCIPADMSAQRHQSGGISIRHARAHLRGVAIVPEGAYSTNAYIESVRASSLHRAREAEIAWLAVYKSRAL